MTRVYDYQLTDQDIEDICEALNTRNCIIETGVSFLRAKDVTKAEQKKVGHAQAVHVHRNDALISRFRGSQ
jgi:hypothetical protein